MRPQVKSDFVVKLLDVTKNTTRDVIVHVEVRITAPRDLYSFYIAALLASEEKCKKNEAVVRVSRKGYS